ncbi:hypothetical protein I4U23_003203 [Adineta vaga]|nr:hypothetical protein I4U23_003203 [Adineta vaga]
MATNNNGTSTFTSNRFESSHKTKDDLLNEILQCGICLSRMSSPCCLPCAHAFCRSCLIDYAENNYVNTSSSMNYIRCPYCNIYLNYSSIEQLETMLIVNPTLRQLCEVLEAAKTASEQTNAGYQARCHTCCSLQMLKICKHCSFMLCATCRRTHLLDVHRESKFQLDILDSRLRLINDKRSQLNQMHQEYDRMKELIHSYTEKLMHTINEQCTQAFQILDERQHSNDETFWIGNGFDNGEKLDFFIALLDTGKRKLSAKNITDRDLMDLSDNLQTIPDVDENLLNSMTFSQVSLIVDETCFTKQFIRIGEKNEPSMATDIPEEASHLDNEQTESNQT